jgi:ABC-type phosphate transport system substrate-binding protein
MRMPRAAVIAILLAAAAIAQTPLLAWSAGAQNAAPPAFRVVVNHANPYGRLPREFVANAFLRKTSRWGHGETIRPVDQDGDSSVRRKFSSDVLRRSVSAVRNYWQQLIFSGRGLPPAELDSDQAVIGYVARNAGAIGYVSGSADVNGVKVVSLE